ncbi:MAG: hypothetical protein AAF383_30810, partial [Cyanobacteria bacterium P01_A01_bin.83]
MPGIVKSYIHTGNQIGVLIELKCQHKVTAITSEFKTLANEIALHIAANPQVKYIKVDQIPNHIIEQIRRRLESKGKPEDMEACIEALCLYRQSYLRDSSITIEDLIKLSTAQLSDSIFVNRFVRFAIEDSEEDFPNDPGNSVPSSPFPISPSPLTNETEIDIENND